MNLAHLRYFKTIAETGNVTSAAKKLYIAQPALSKALNSLEQDLDYKLFDRVGKTLVLNEQGKILLRYANQIFDSLEDAQKEMADSYEANTNVVHIRISSGAKYFVSMLAELRRDNPEISFHITDNTDSDTSYNLPDISIFADEEDSETSNCETLFKEDMVLAVPVSHPLASKASVCAADFKNESFLATSGTTAMRHSLDRYCKSKEFVPYLSCESSNTSLVKSMVANGLGISIVPSITWADVVEHGLVTLIPISDIDFCRYVHIQWNDERYLSLACKKTLDYLFSKHA